MKRECWQGGLTVFGNLITEVKFHHFCYILLLRSKSLGPAHTPWLWIPEEGALRSLSEAVGLGIRNLVLFIQFYSDIIDK